MRKTSNQFGLDVITDKMLQQERRLLGLDEPCEQEEEKTSVNPNQVNNFDFETRFSVCNSPYAASPAARGLD